jgi:transcriptional regulator with XRE-family HTH domain
MPRINHEIKQSIKSAGLHQYQVADQMGIAETTLVRWLRYELQPERKEQIYKAIKELTK